MVKLLATLLLAVSALPQDAPPKSADESLCGEATGIYLPAPQGTPAPNIELKNFQYMSPGDRCGRNVSHDELMRLHANIKTIAAKAFGDSPGRFSVMVRYTLTPDKPAVFDMQVKDAVESDGQRLTDFYNQASALNDYHAQNLVHVVFEYVISPSAGGKPKAGG